MSNYTVLAEKRTAEASPEAVLTAGVIKTALDGEKALFDVLPGMGKSRSILTLAKETEMPITVFTNIRDNYDQFKRWGDQVGVDVEKLPTRSFCPTLRDDDPAYVDDPDARRARAARDANWSPSVIHRELNPPCDQGESNCPYQEKIRGVDLDRPRILVGHFTLAHNPAYVKDRVVVLDESCFDAFRQEIKNPKTKADEFVSTLDSFPFDEVRRPEPGEKQKRVEALHQLEQQGLDPSDHSGSAGEFHAKAPLAAYAIYGADRLDNGLYLVQHEDQTVVFDNPHEGSLQLLDPPDLSNAGAVLALDATPCLSNWERILGENLEHYRLFDDEQRNRYLRQRGYEFRQLHNYVWPVSDADVSVAKCEAYLREIQHKHGQRPDLITSKSLRTALEDRGVNHLWHDELHFGDLRGKNDLRDSELLAVLGSPGRPDSHYQYQAAFHDECAEPATDEAGERLSGYDLDYQSDVANDNLETTRQGEVFQAAMRAGRSADAEATVYIATGMIPEWLSTTPVGREQQGGTFDACIRTRSEAERDVIMTLRREDEISGGEVARRADLPASTARGILRTLQDDDVVEKTGVRKGARWHDTGLDRLNAAGEVDLTPVSSTRFIDEIPLEEYNMGVSSKKPLLDQRSEGTSPFGYPPWIKKIRHRARQQRHAERLRGAY